MALIGKLSGARTIGSLQAKNCKGAIGWWEFRPVKVPSSGLHSYKALKGHHSSICPYKVLQGLTRG